MEPSAAALISFATKIGLLLKFCDEVSDSFDIWRACRDYWGGQLKDLIKGRHLVEIIHGSVTCWIQPSLYCVISPSLFAPASGITDTKFGRLVVRPDSGDPAETCTSILKRPVSMRSTSRQLGGC